MIFPLANFTITEFNNKKIQFAFKITLIPTFKMLI